MSPPLVAFEGLSVGFRKRRGPLLTQARGQVMPGQFTVLVGLNGTGKSTLLRTLAGLHPPLAGTLSWGGHATLPALARAQQIALVATGQAVPPLLTVEEALAMGRYPYQRWRPHLSATDRQAMAEAAAHTHLEPLLSRRLRTLSDGERQRVFIAQGLAQATPLLLLDEPTAHLDYHARREILLLLQSLAKTTGKGVLCATHELELAHQLADEVWAVTPARTLTRVVPNATPLNELLALLGEVA